MTRTARPSSSLLSLAGSLALVSLGAFGAFNPSAARADVPVEASASVASDMGVEARLVESDADRGLPITFGVMADVGVPDGFVGSLSVRAYDRFEFYVGGGHNSMSPGVRAGVQVAALTGAISPYAAFEGGHYVPGEASAWVKALATSAGLDESVELDQVGYSYGNAHLGLRLGGESAAFYVQAGMSIVTLDVTVRGEGLPPMAPVDDDGSMSVPTISKWTPSGRVGMVAFF